MSESDRPESPVRTLNGAYPIDVMLRDIANSPDGPYRSGVFIGIDASGEARITYSLKNGVMELNFLSTVLETHIQNVINGVE